MPSRLLPVQPSENPLTLYSLDLPTVQNVCRTSSVKTSQVRQTCCSWTIQVFFTSFLHPPSPPHRGHPERRAANALRNCCGSSTAVSGARRRKWSLGRRCVGPSSRGRSALLRVSGGPFLPKGIALVASGAAALSKLQTRILGKDPKKSFLETD